MTEERLTAADEKGGFYLGHLQMPAGMSIDVIRAAISVIENWEVSSKSACELIVALHPILWASFLRGQVSQAR